MVDRVRPLPRRRYPYPPPTPAKIFGTPTLSITLCNAQMTLEILNTSPLSLHIANKKIFLAKNWDTKGQTETILSTTLGAYKSYTTGMNTLYTLLALLNVCFYLILLYLFCLSLIIF